MWRRLREDFNIPAHVSRKFPAQTCAVRLLRVTPHTYLPTFHLRLHICKTAPVCGASKSLTRFRGNPNLAERKSNRWPYRSQWLSGALHPSRREKGFLDARHWHFLCRLIGIHHHQATFFHHHNYLQYCHCYKGVILAHYQHDLQHIVWLPWCCSSSPRRWQSDRVGFPPGKERE